MRRRRRKAVDCVVEVVVMLVETVMIDAGREGTTAPRGSE